MTRQAVVTDCETTGLDWDRHALWEVAALIWRPGRTDAGVAPHPDEWLWRVKPHATAEIDPDAMAVNRFDDRTAGMAQPIEGLAVNLAARLVDYRWSDPVAVAAKLADLLTGATIVGAVPGFDAGFIRAFLARHLGIGPTWHYRVRDIQSLAHGYLCASARAGMIRPAEIPPFDSSTDTYAVALGIDPGGYDRHSALGDVRLEAAMLDVVTRRPA